MMATTQPPSNIPVKITAPALPQPLASSSLSAKRAKSRKLQSVQSAKLRASSADDIQSTTEALVPVVSKSSESKRNVKKCLPQNTVEVMVSNLKICLFHVYLFLFNTPLQPSLTPFLELNSFTFEFFLVWRLLQGNLTKSDLKRFTLSSSASP